MDDYTNYIKKVIIDQISACTDDEFIQFLYGIIMETYNTAATND